jgi:uncharacterized protein YjiS (DUF1127 family)
MIPAAAGTLAGTGWDDPYRGKDETMFASVARLFHAWTRANAARRELSHMSDRELADIGITRSDIERIVANHVDD